MGSWKEKTAPAMARFHGGLFSSRSAGAIRLEILACDA
jgi:hypothetical protein